MGFPKYISQKETKIFHTKAGYDIKYGKGTSRERGDLHGGDIIFLEQRRDVGVFRRRKARIFFLGGAETSTRKGEPP